MCPDVNPSSFSFIMFHKSNVSLLLYCPLQNVVQSRVHNFLGLIGSFSIPAITFIALHINCKRSFHLHINSDNLKSHYRNLCVSSRPILDYGIIQVWNVSVSRKIIIVSLYRRTVPNLYHEICIWRNIVVVIQLTTPSFLNIRSIGIDIFGCTFSWLSSVVDRFWKTLQLEYWNW